MLQSEEIKALLIQFEDASAEIESVECWSARELQNLLGYSLWQNFEKVLAKARSACQNAGEDVENHFIDANKMVEIGSGAQKQIKDILQPYIKLCPISRICMFTRSIRHLTGRRKYRR